MVLSGAEYSMAVMAAFSLSLVAILSNGPFSINKDILGFFQNCSYTVLVLSFRRTSGMPRTESSSAMSQDYLDFYYTSSALSLLGSGLGPQCKNGPGLQIIGPHKHIFVFQERQFPVTISISRNLQIVILLIFLAENQK